MFNGIIYKTGTILKINKGNNSSAVVLKTNYVFKKSEASALYSNPVILFK